MGEHFKEICSTLKEFTLIYFILKIPTTSLANQFPNKFLIDSNLFET